MSTWDEKVLNIIRCQICARTITDPRNLYCGHTFCHNCIEKWHQEQNDSETGTNAASCPICRRTFILDNNGANGLPVNYHLKDLIEVINASKGPQKVRNCELCRLSTPHAAISTCIDCKLDMCNECRETHKKFRDASTHYVADISESNEQMTLMRKKRSYCTSMSHENHELELYCKECSKPICTKCSLLDHKLHRVEELWIHAKENRKILDQILVETKEKRREYLKGIDSVEKAKDSFRCRKSEAEEQIRNITSMSIHAMKRKETEELDKIETHFQEKSKELDTEEEELRNNIGMIDSLNTFTDSLRNYGSDANVVLQVDYADKQSSELCKLTVCTEFKTDNSFFSPNENFLKILDDLKKESLGIGRSDASHGSNCVSKGTLDESSSGSEEWSEHEFDDDDGGTSAELKPNVPSRPPPVPSRTKRDNVTTQSSEPFSQEEMNIPKQGETTVQKLRSTIKRRFDAKMNVTGMTVTERNEVIIVSNEDSLIKVYSQDGDKLCSLKRKGFGNPWDAACGEDGAIFISDTGEKTFGIKMLQRKNKKYAISTFLREPENPHGVSFLGGYLYVCDPTAIKVFSYNAKTKRPGQTIDVSSKGLSCPIYVSVSSNKHLLVSDHVEKKVYIVSLDDPHNCEPVLFDQKLHSSFSPAQTCICSNDRYFVADTLSKEVYVLQENETIEKIGFSEQMKTPIALDSRCDGTIWVATRQGVIMLFDCRRRYENY